MELPFEKFLIESGLSGCFLVMVWPTAANAHVAGKRDVAMEQSEFIRLAIEEKMHRARRGVD